MAPVRQIALVTDVIAGPIDSKGIAFDPSSQMDDDDRPKAGQAKPNLGTASLLNGESLDAYSLDELDARVALLEAEIARTSSHRQKAAAHMKAAQDLFRPKSS